jgi:hypothetical protein
MGRRGFRFLGNFNLLNEGLKPICGARAASCRRGMLPALWPKPAVWTDVGELMLLVFTPDGVPTREVGRRAKLTRAYNRRANQLRSGREVKR